jgi:putative PIN family toxin of toxin-antitoxin system
MMKIVLDTNVIISATLIRGGNEDRLLRAWQRSAFELILSPAILEEVGRALSYEKIKKRRWVTDEEALLLIEMLAEKSTLVSGNTKVATSRDTDDDKFLAAALEGKADYLVTGDRDLLSLKRFRDTQIVKPTEFLRLLREEERK